MSKIKTAWQIAKILFFGLMGIAFAYSVGYQMATTF